MEHKTPLNDDKTYAEELTRQIAEGTTFVDDLDAVEVEILAKHYPEALKTGEQE